MTTMSKNNGTAAARAAYARPVLTVYGSVRELTGGMSGVSADGMSPTGAMA